jgi:hypothetical protein
MAHATGVELPFLYVGGDPALDLVNTVDWTSRGPEAERIETFERLTRWAEGAGIIDPAGGRRLRRIAEERPRAAATALANAHQARGALRELFGAIARGETSDQALTRFNRLLREALAGLEIAPARESETGYRWRWREEESDPRAIVWRVLWSAASLLRSDEAANVRM